MMIEVQITEDHLLSAKRKASSVGILQGSITGGMSNVVGALGEVIVAELLGAKEVNSKDYDLIDGNIRIDVKTKRCNTKPLRHYDCSVAAHGTKQDCDSYVFVRILTSLKIAWVLGKIDKDIFYNKATRYKRGDFDPANGFVFKADCYNLPVSELNDILAENKFYHAQEST